VVERFYLHEDTLKEIACAGDHSYYDYVRIKNKALEKLKKYI
jgi:RNA polymerase sporulation-specific sigma factor